MKAVLIGYGCWGRNLARVLMQQGRLAAVVDSDAAARSACRQQFPGLAVLSSTGELAWSGFNATLIATPPAAHVAQGLEALAAGMDVFIEKPLALNRDGATRLATSAAAADRLLMTGHILEHHPAARALLQLCRAGEIGELRQIKAVRTRRLPRSAHGSVMHELLWHDVALALLIAGRPPEAAQFAETGRGAQDRAVLDIKFGALRATLRGDQQDSVRRSRFVVTGSGGTLEFDDEQTWSDKLRLHRRGNVQAVAVTPGEPLALELEHFANCVRTRAPPGESVTRSLEILALLEACEPR